MAYSVNFTTGVITIPQADLVYLDVGRYKLDLDEFRRKCRAIEADPLQGLSYPDIITYYPTIDTGDVILGRTVLINTPYTVEFEDGQYAVVFDGANTNLHNFTVVNQVSIRPNNSAGLQDLSTILSLAYSGGVYIDQFNLTGVAQAGTSAPIGTQGRPVNNWSDAVEIANQKNTSTIVVIGNGLLGSGDDVSNMHIRGTNPLTSVLEVQPAAECSNLYVDGMTFFGTLDGGSLLRDCLIANPVYYFNGFIENCALATDAHIYMNGNAYIINSRSVGYPTFHLDDAASCFISNFDGDINITGQVNDIVTHIVSNGEVLIDETCTNGKIEIHGDVQVTYNGSVNIFDDQSTGTPAEIAALVGSGGLDEASLHSALDTYTNKNDWKADVSNLSADVNIVEVNGVAVTSIDDFKADSIDLSPVITAINELNDISTDDVVTALAASFASIPDDVWTKYLNDGGIRFTDTEKQMIRIAKEMVYNKVVVSSDERVVTVYDNDKVSPRHIIDVSSDQHTREPR